MKKTDNYLDEAIENIRKDREITKDLLNDLIVYLSKDEALVKLVTLLEKKKSTSVGLTDDDKTEIFDLLNGES